MKLRLAAIVCAEDVAVIADWLVKYFGFTAHVDSIGVNGELGCVEMKRGRDEILLASAINVTPYDVQHVPPAQIVLVVDNIEDLRRRFLEDGIKHVSSHDIGARPSIDFVSPAGEPSPFRMFSIEEAPPEEWAAP